jgi:calcineurin-like phosphoesterase family protein
MKLKLLSILTAFLIFSQTGFPYTVNGIVFCDKNNNGIKEKGEKVLSKIPVSNGTDIIMTDRNGFYTLSVEPGNSVFPILPSGYLMSGTKNRIQNACFKYIDPAEPVSEITNVDFAVKSIPLSDSFSFGAVGDIQVDDIQEIKYTNQTFVSEMLGRNDLDFNLFLGDLVNEKPQLMSDVKCIIEQLPAFSWTVYGNHDRKINLPFPQEMFYNKLMGASTFSFNYNNVHFVLLNNVQPKGKAGYEGGITESQIKFIQNDLKLVPKQRQVVFATHIPILYTSNKDTLLDIIQLHKNVLFISAHMHATGRIFLNDKRGRVIPELIAGATCGGWWTGERDEYGNPSGLMQCGCPRNYYEISFNKGGYNLKFKGIGLDKGKQMDIWINGQDTLYNHLKVFTELPERTVLANIFGGCDSSVVSIQIDNMDTVLMEKILIVAPNVKMVSALNKSDIYPTPFSKRGALRSTPSPHIWRFQLPDNLKPGIHTIKIHARDCYGYDVTNSVTFLI